ncbi:virulence-associated E family protein [Nostoc sp.]|uniref:virulence-associated E family protein n=1 Tax=Nostoc sp. TaxID=1180 RepID=UPI002FF77BF3
MSYNISTVTYSSDTANSFLTILGNAPWLFQTFDDNSTRKDKSLTRQFYGSLDEHWNELVELNKRGAGVFVTVNQTDGATRKAENITSVRALFIDCDNGLPSEFHNTPSIVVNSSCNDKGHAYWVLSEPSNDVDKFTAKQQQLINYYVSDKAVKDLPRVMRLPGLFHMKGEATLVTFNQTGKRYKLMDDITDGLIISTPPRVREEPLTEHITTTDNEFQLLLAELLTSSKEGERNNTLNTVSFKAGRLVKDGKLADNVAREQLTNVAGIIGLGRNEALATINSGINAGLTKPPKQPTDKRSKSNIMRDRLNQFFNDEHCLQWDEMKNKLRFDGQHVSVEKLHDIAEWELDIDLPFESFKRTAAVNAMSKPYHAVREYLNGLTPISDKVARDVILTNLYMAMGINDNSLYQTYVRRWLVSAVNRAMVPGCKADVALILKGTQGIGKTTFFEKLFSKEYFQTIGEHKSDVDALLAMNRSWCIEMGEIENAFSRKAVSAIKNFMSTTSDTYRRPYAAEPDDYHRHFIVCGTTNEDKFLNDGTGNRRFWVIDCGDRDIDLASVEANRDAIWSAVLWLYQNGEQGYLTQTEAIAAADDVKQYEDEHPWTETIAAYMTRHNPCTISDIMTNGLGFDVKQLNDKKQQASVSTILKKLCCTKKQMRHNGVKGRVLTLWEIKPKFFMQFPCRYLRQ